MPVFITAWSPIVSLSKWLSQICVPLKLLNKLEPVETSLDVYWGILEAFTGWESWTRSWLGSLDARHAASFLGAVPESNNSHSRNVQDIDNFSTDYLNVWTRQIYKEPKNPALCCRACMQTMTMVLEGKESASREIHQITLIIDWEM